MTRNPRKIIISIFSLQNWAHMIHVTLIFLSVVTEFSKQNNSIFIAACSFVISSISTSLGTNYKLIMPNSYPYFFKTYTL